MSFKAFLFVSSVVRWKAPNRPRSEVTWLIASSTIVAAVVGSVARSAEPPEPSWNSLPLTPPSRAVFTLVMPMRACWFDDHVRTELEQGTTAGDVKAIVPVKPVVDRRRQVQRRGVDRDHVAVALALMPLTEATTSVPSSRAPGADRAVSNRAAGAFADHLDVDEGVAAVGCSSAARASCR